MYKIVGADGKQYGPVSLEQFKQWVAQSRVNPQTRVQAEGSTEWKPAGEIPELNELFTTAGAGSSAALPPISPLTMGPGQEPAKGLAISSFVLGLLSLICFGPFTGIPAIICGHIARSHARRLPTVYGGGGFAIAGLVLGYVGVLVSILVYPAMLLPALARAKERAQSISCQNNMKQIGLAFKIWAADHNGQFPFNVSTNGGGTLELCMPAPNGLDNNAVVHLRVMSNELSTPKILICPADKKQSAPAFQFLQQANLSYQLYSGTNITDANPLAVLLVCPIHGHELLTDGSIQSGHHRVSKQ